MVKGPHVALKHMPHNLFKEKFFVRQHFWIVAIFCEVGPHRGSVVKMSRSKLFILGLCMDSCDLLYVLNPFEQERPEFLCVVCSVADPGCLSRICIKEFKYLFKLSEI
jgi:hypothetical protein